ncbi:hypothetical protein RRG08_018898 [Elysia crispata]|uniref:Uncharacterized protein n=1 Tax=Elysia crispata TaxID=231223 RepID=A0AAE1A9E7_9GAST|nr:hypothetical protein RRG08_018898 [Elysia crispata]
MCILPELGRQLMKAYFCFLSKSTIDMSHSPALVWFKVSRDLTHSTLTCSMICCTGGQLRPVVGCVNNAPFSQSNGISPRTVRKSCSRQDPST